MKDENRKPAAVRVKSVKDAKRLLSRLMSQLQRDEISVEKARALAYLANSYVKMTAAADEELLDARAVRRRAKREMSKRGIDTSHNALITRANTAAVEAEIEALSVDEKPLEIELADGTITTLEDEQARRASPPPVTSVVQENKPTTSVEKSISTPAKKDGGQGKMEEEAPEDSEAEYGGLRAFKMNSQGQCVRLQPASPISRPAGPGIISRDF
jgi:hypothetical protein